MSRRDFLAACAGTTALWLASSLPGGSAHAAPKWSADPFSLGVASGSPVSDGVVLWTRLAPDPLKGGGMPYELVEVRWEVARDEHFEHIVRAGAALTRPELAHSAHVEVTGLEPATWYWYRFRAGDAFSPVGRTRTAPAPGAMPERLRFAFASCQNYEHGYFVAYRHMLADDPELVVFLGDYIYEHAGRVGRVRTYPARACRTLADYRDRYALHKSEPELQRMHAAAPWLVTWDDHEVANDYADDRPQIPAYDFPARRAAAYQAWYEHMPVRSAAAIAGLGTPDLRIYARHDHGALARFLLLDGRQYRSPQACPRRGRGGGNTVDDETCPQRREAGRTMLGREQETWLAQELATPGARWNFIAQQTLMAQLDYRSGPGQRFWTDGWDGYPAARARLMQAIAQAQPSNPVVIGGDRHSNWVADLKADFDDPAAPVLATEFCGTSITSNSGPRSDLQGLLAENPHIRFADTAHPGYVLVELTADELFARLRVVDGVGNRDSGARTLASFAVDNGRPGARRVD